MSNKQEQDKPEQDKPAKPVARVAKKAKLPELKNGQKRIAEGCSVTTKRGILAHPQGVAAQDLGGGEKALATLASRGIVEK